MLLIKNMIMNIDNFDDFNEKVRRPLTAYAIFSKEYRKRKIEDLMQENGIDKNSAERILDMAGIKELMASNDKGSIFLKKQLLVGMVWKEMSEGQKAPYRALAEEQLKRAQDNGYNTPKYKKGNCGFLPIDYSDFFDKLATIEEHTAEQLVSEANSRILFHYIVNSIANNSQNSNFVNKLIKDEYMSKINYLMDLPEIINGQEDEYIKTFHLNLCQAIDTNSRLSEALADYQTRHLMVDVEGEEEEEEEAIEPMRNAGYTPSL